MMLLKYTGNNSITCSGLEKNVIDDDFYYGIGNIFWCMQATRAAAGLVWEIRLDIVVHFAPELRTCLVVGNESYNTNTLPPRRMIYKPGT